MEALHLEIQGMGDRLKALGIGIQTVYIGGGTPTVLEEAPLGSLMEQIRQALPLAPDLEWTVEGGGPETLTDRKLKVLVQGGVTRLCINPQTLRPETLAAIGRPMELSQLHGAFETARACGVRTINSDLIMGLPGECADDVQRSIEGLLAYRPENITMHALAIKRASMFRERAEDISLRSNHMAERADQVLNAGGYAPYYLYRQKDILDQAQNTGYALPGKACLYNIQMMEERQSVLGFGVGAASKLVRVEDGTLVNMRNPKDIKLYLERFQENLRRKVDKLNEIV
jgi:oxygen-independent coproporphyrinogen-3 oxidase